MATTSLSAYATRAAASLASMHVHCVITILFLRETGRNPGRVLRLPPTPRAVPSGRSPAMAPLGGGHGETGFQLPADANCKVATGDSVSVLVRVARARSSRSATPASIRLHTQATSGTVSNSPVTPKLSRP